MPIKNENKGRYPKNWTEIRERIIQRAGNQCEICGLRNHSVGYRDDKGDFHPSAGNVAMEDFGKGIDPQTGRELKYQRAKETADWQTENDEMGYKYIVIVCTVAHLDHTPENCDDNNLAFLCQQCHNRHDTQHRKQTVRDGRNKGQIKLFIEINN